MNDCLFTYCFLFVLTQTVAQGGDIIQLVNPSFEDTPSCCSPPAGWKDCGFKGETPPDVHPSLNYKNQPFFNVTQKAMDGNTYLGMVVRETETYERISQKLIKPLRKDVCYTFSIMLCRSDSYLSAINRSNPSHLVEFIKPVILRIWGGDAICHKKQLLVISNPVENTEWMKYDFLLKPEVDLNFIQFEAYYYTKMKFPYNGNLLLDKASDIIRIECNLTNPK